MDLYANLYQSMRLLQHYNKEKKNNKLSIVDNLIQIPLLNNNSNNKLPTNKGQNNLVEMNKIMLTIKNKKHNSNNFQFNSRSNSSKIYIN